MLQEREKLQQAVQSANEQVLAKAGEISIVRANLAKTVKDHGKKVSEIQSRHVEAIEQQNAIIAKVKSDSARIATEHEFAALDQLAEITRPKGAQKKAAPSGDSSRSKPNARDNDPATPTKNRILPFRDGFEDNEAMVTSPSKKPAKPSTPKASAKRKRNAIDKSPGLQLELSQPMGDILPDAPMEGTDSQDFATHKDSVGLDDYRYQVSIRLLYGLLAADPASSLSLLSITGWAITRSEPWRN